MNRLRPFWLLALSLILVACAGPLGLEKPKVNITSFRALPASTLVPEFEIGLHVINPNRVALPLKGIVYTVSVEGHQLLTGVSNQLPEIPAYGEGDVRLKASPDLLGGMSLIAQLMRSPKEEFGYEVKASLDVGSLWPNIPVSDKGTFSLGAR